MFLCVCLHMRVHVHVRTDMQVGRHGCTAHHLHLCGPCASVAGAHVHARPATLPPLLCTSPPRRAHPCMGLHEGGACVCKPAREPQGCPIIIVRCPIAGGSPEACRLARSSAAGVPGPYTRCPLPVHARHRASSCSSPPLWCSLRCASSGCVDAYSACARLLPVRAPSAHAHILPARWRPAHQRRFIELHGWRTLHMKLRGSPGFLDRDSMAEGF